MVKEGNDPNESTFDRSEEEYGPDYQSHLMELYKFYAGTADAVRKKTVSECLFSNVEYGVDRSNRL